MITPLPFIVLQVDRTAVSPHVGDLLAALILCFKDMGWPVRDAACTAFGRFVYGDLYKLADAWEVQK